MCGGLLFGFRVSGICECDRESYETTRAASQSFIFHFFFFFGISKKINSLEPIRFDSITCVFSRYERYNMFKFWSNFTISNTEETTTIQTTLLNYCIYERNRTVIRAGKFSKSISIDIGIGCLHRTHGMFYIHVKVGRYVFYFD